MALKLVPIGDRKGSPLLYYAWPFVEKWLLEPHRVE